MVTICIFLEYFRGIGTKRELKIGMRLKKALSFPPKFP